MPLPGRYPAPPNFVDRNHWGRPTMPSRSTLRRAGQATSAAKHWKKQIKHLSRELRRRLSQLRPRRRRLHALVSSFDRRRPPTRHRCRKRAAGMHNSSIRQLVILRQVIRGWLPSTCNCKNVGDPVKRGYPWNRRFSLLRRSQSGAMDRWSTGGLARCSVR
jgi:hypothetical protein